MRILFDTNVIISAFITNGSSYEIFNYCLRNHSNFISDFIVAEVKEKLLTKFKYDETIVENVINFLKKNLIVIKHEVLKDDICKDIDDDNILASAVAAAADCIITGDLDLIELNKYGNIIIISPKNFRRFEKEFNKTEIKLFMEFKVGKSKLVILQGDITKQDTNAIVNAANEYLSPGGGVSGAIHGAAGNKLWDECKKLGRCRTGEAKITKGHNLKTKYVIHTVGPVYSNNPEDEINLKNSYRNSLEIARKNNLKSISFPSISTGIFRYPVKEASEIAIKTIASFLKENPDNVLAQMVLFSKEDYEIYKKTALKFFNQ